MTRTPTKSFVNLFLLFATNHLSNINSLFRQLHVITLKWKKDRGFSLLFRKTEKRKQQSILLLSKICWSKNGINHGNLKTDYQDIKFDHFKMLYGYFLLKKKGNSPIFSFSSNLYFQQKNSKVVIFSLIYEKLFKFMTSQTSVITFLSFIVFIS